MNACIYCRTPSWSLTNRLCDECIARFTEAAPKPKPETKPKPRLIVDNTVVGE